MKLIKIGKVLRTHALKGAVQAELYTEDINEFSKYDEIYVLNTNLDKKNKAEESIEIQEEFLNEKFIRLEQESLSTVKGRALIKFKQIQTIEEAEKIVNKYIYVYIEDDEIQTSADEYYIFELIGLEVIDVNKTTNETNELGKVDNIITIGPSESLEISLNEKQQDIFKIKQIIVPMVEEYILDIDTKNKKITIDLGGLREFYNPNIVS